MFTSCAETIGNLSSVSKPLTYLSAVHKLNSMFFDNAQSTRINRVSVLIWIFFAAMLK